MRNKKAKEYLCRVLFTSNIVRASKTHFQKYFRTEKNNLLNFFKFSQRGHYDEAKNDFQKHYEFT